MKKMLNVIKKLYANYNCLNLFFVQYFKTEMPFVLTLLQFDTLYCYCCKIFTEYML